MTQLKEVYKCKVCGNIVDGKSYTTFLKSGDKPEAEFNVTGTDIKARIYCNLHGLWISK